MDERKRGQKEANERFRVSSDESELCDLAKSHPSVVRGGILDRPPGKRGESSADIG